jgi:lysozyme
VTRLYGPDVSFWQDDNNTPQGINFAQMREAGASFVILRAGQGAWIDPDFAKGYAAAKAAGLPRGVYWYFDSRYSPLAQALLCASAVGQDFPELGVWLDLEESYGGTYKGWQNWANCLQSLKTKFPRVGIYTGYYYWFSNRPSDPDALKYFKAFDLWIAHYGVTTPLVPSPWISYVFWQFTDHENGLKFGAESLEIDMNVFYGDDVIFRNYFDLPDPTPQEQTTMRYEAISTYNMSRRPDHNTANSPLGSIPAQSRIHGNELWTAPGERWLRIEDIGGTASSGWVAVESAYRVYCALEEINPPTEPPPAEPADTITVNVEATITATINGRTYSGDVRIEGLELA